MPGLKTMHRLFFADDVILVSDTIRGLQNRLNLKKMISERLGLEVNLDKTQIVVFRKGGHLSKYEHWHYGTNNLNVVNSYKYLGIDFPTKLSFVNCTTSFIMKAKKSCIELLKSLDTINCCTLDIFLKLFDSKVLPMLSYGCELWGVQDITRNERVHTFGLKRFLNVSLHCQNYVVYGDTGRYPLYICHKIRVLKYWFRLLKMSKSKICRQAYEM